MTTLIDEAIKQLDTALVWLELPPGNYLRWHPDEDAALRKWWGRIPRPDLAERVSRVLRQITGDPAARRTVNACADRAYQLALPAYDGEPGEMSLTKAAKAAGVPFHVAHQAVRNGLLPATKKGKQLYVSELTWALWLVWYRERLLLREEILSAVEGEDLLTKQEAMKLTSLRETHLTRYLHTGVIRGWLLPGVKTGRPGEWLVSKASALALMAARSEGRLRALLDRNPAYVALRGKQTKEVNALRRAGRLKKRDPLLEPKSLYHPGSFTVQQVASHLGLSSQVVYQAIADGRISAEVCVVGGRPRYAVAPSEARRYAREVARQPDSMARRDTRYLRQIAEVGLLTVRDLARRWHRSEATVLLWVRQAELPSRKWGRYRVFEPEVVASFEIARSAGFLTLRDLAERWGKSVATAGLWTRQAGLPRRKWGRSWVFEPEIIALFEAERGLK